MADFWIKLEKNTPDKPEVLEMSAILGIDDPDTIVGKLLRVWSWMDSHIENGHAPSVTNVLIDRMTGVQNFTDAMESVGWLTKNDDGYTISNFSRHMGSTSKKRALDAERKRKSRNTSEKCHATKRTKSVTEKGLDKSRVDKSILSNKNTLSEQSSDVIENDDLTDIEKPTGLNGLSEKPKKPTGLNQKPKPKYLQWDMDFAKYMHQSILEIAPLTKKPNFDDWANTIRLIRESDGINYDVIQSVFEWANKDSFWKTNIKSPSKLRVKFADLHSKMLNPPKTYVTAAQRMADVSQRIEKMDSIEDFEF